MAKTNAIDKYMLGMCGEYAVCSELLKRGKMASVTMGNAKSVDIIVTDPSSRQYKKIEVKTSQTTKFVTSFFRKYYDISMPHPDIWVLVHIDANTKAVRFFILEHEELGNIQMGRNKITSWQYSNGCDNVLLKEVLGYENRWNII
jgi:hypothetical protein